MAFDPNYWLNQQQQVTPNEQIPGSVPYTAPKVNPVVQNNTTPPVVQPNTSQVGSSVAGMQYNSNFGYDPSAWNKGREYWNNISNNPLNIAMANDEQKAKVEIEENKNEIGSDVQLDAAGNPITGDEFKFDAETGKPILAKTQEKELATGGEEGLLGKYIAEQNPELYGKMTDDEGLFQGGVEGRSFGRLKDFFEGQGSFWDKMKERKNQRMMQKSGFAGQDDIGSLKLSKEDNRHDAGSTGGSTGGQTKDDEDGLSDEQKIAMGQAFSQMAQGHRGSYGTYGDIF